MKGRNSGIINTISDTMSTTTDDDNGGIPTVVQRALGMQNLTTHQNCNDGASNTTNNNVICGLEGFLLPRYLALRSERTFVVQNDNNSSYDMLIRAKNEELQHRVGGHKQQKVDASKSSCRPRKRKRKADHRGISDDNNMNCNDAVRGGDADNDMQSESDAPTKSKSRKRRRRRKRSSNQSNNTNNKDDWLHYQMMARIIVAPFTSSLITTMNKCKQLEKQNEKSCSHDSLGDDADNTTPNVNQVMPSSTTSNTAEKGANSVSAAAVKNVYQKSSTNSTHSKPNNNLLLTLSSPQESLATIVDGAVCTLVRRTHRHRSTKSSKMFKSSRNKSVGKKNEKQKILYRRRKRQKSNRDTSMATTSSTTMNTNNSNNNWLLEQNLLSTGYTLGSGETYSSSHNNLISNSNTNQNNQLLRGCPNMAPGIHCLHPNTLTSYARSSHLMKVLHTLIGDDALREMLVNAVILVPAISTTTEDSKGEQQSMFDRGNYFQLSGPPLNKLAKKFDEMSNSCVKASTNSVVRKRKRNDTAGDSPNVDTKQKKDKTTHRDEERWDPNQPIPRGNLFYCDFYNKHVGLSPNHLLNQSDEDVPSSSEASTAKSNNNMDVNVKLLNSMVRIWPGRRPHQPNESSKVAINGNKRRGRWRRLRESGISMCQEMRRRHKQCDYARLLERHCPLPTDTSIAASVNNDTKTALSHYVTLHTPVDNVGSFLEAVLDSAFPNSFWGSINNFHQVVQTVRVFVHLGRTEQLPEKAIVDGIRVLDMTWLLPNANNNNKGSSAKPNNNKRRKLSRSEHESTSVLVRNVMRWLYKQFIIPLLRSTFYITETEFTGSRVLYYRRPIWSRIKSLSMKILLKQQYREMNVAKVQKLLSNHNVGCPPAPLRLLPKKTGIRAIAMLSKSCETDDAMAAIMNQQQSKMAPPNKILQSTFHALKYEHEKKPTLFGAGVLGLTEVFPSFCTFVEALKQRRSNNGGSTTTNSRLDDQDSQLYFASADIKHCYDNINQKHLLKLMKSVIDEDVYMTKNNFILHSKDNKSSLRCRWKKNTFSTDQFSRFLATSNALVDKCFNSILVDGVHCSMEKKETITGLLRDHIFGQVVVANGNHGQRYLLQRNGIPQGSILSSMFCNIYFGNIERYLLKDVFDKDSSHVIRGSSSSADCNVVFIQSKHDLHLLVRIVDDFLLISTSKETSIRFLNKLNKGIPKLGVKINSDKSRVNYPTSLGDTITNNNEQVTRVSNDFFPWCGLLINTKTCEISLDYSRFSGLQATDTVVIHRGGNEGMNLKKKMKDFVRPRCNQKLLFSSQINGMDMIRLNFYQTFVLCAIKLVHYLNGSGVSLSGHEQFIFNSACDTIHYAFLLISSKLKHGGLQIASSTDTNVDSSVFQLEWKDALWLGRHAFSSVFMRLGKQKYAKLFKLFMDERVSNRKDLLLVARQALKMWSV